MSSQYEPRTPPPISGTRRPDHRIVQEASLPPTARTMDQLADSIRNRNQQQNRVSSTSTSSRYSTDSNVGLHCSDPGYALSYGPAPLPVPRPQPSRTTYNPIVARHRRAAAPVDVILPGTTRSHKYEGFWLIRGTMRKTEADMSARDKWWKKTKEERPSSADGPYEEKSGWF